MLQPDPPTLDAAAAPSWERLHELVTATATGAQLEREAEQRELGKGPPHPAAELRLFDADDESAVRLTLYRDASAWCPYCQKVWLLLEEKRIPFKVVRLPLNAYGCKPAWYSRRVDGGKLPAVEMDGELHVESLEIMHLLDAVFPSHGRMVPAAGSAEAERADALMRLEAEVQRDWFSFVFYPVEGDALGAARAQLLATLLRVELALAETPGPWLLGGEAPALVDVHLVATVERMVASSLYWRGLRLRGRPELPHLEAWLRAWEARPAYLATKSDLYTHAMALPSQNGPGYFDTGSMSISDAICGLDGAWAAGDAGKAAAQLEPLAPLQLAGGEAAARHAAAHALVSQHAAVVPFAARGAAAPGRPAFPAELADPSAEPNEAYFAAVDACLRVVVLALVEGTQAAAAVASEVGLQGACGGADELAPGWEAYDDDSGRTYYWNDETGETTWTAPTRGLDNCLAYLRDRIGVPRDMGAAAARELRVELNWAIGLLLCKSPQGGETIRACDPS
jgi:glutathione S-transferase